MISYETIVDGISAIIVILIVATIIAAAWISTNVREQPLIATAVVVFQRQNEGENTEQNSNEGESQNPTTNDNSNNSSSGSRTNTADTNVAPAPAAEPSVAPSEGPSATPLVAPSVRPKEPRSKVKGVHTMEENTSKHKDKENERNIMEGKIGDAEMHKDDICLEDNSLANELESLSNLNKSLKERGDLLDKCDILGLKGDSGEKTQASSSLSISNESLTNKPNEITPEMEIRNRRLKHFISMGNEENLGNISETIIESNLYEDSSHQKNTNSEEDSDTRPKIKSDSAVDSSLSDSSSAEASEDKSSVEANDKKEEIPAPPGSIRIRLKFLDDTLRFVHALPTDLIGQFKRQQFSLEISENRHIRLIFNGQLLSSDSSTLAHYGLFDNCVVHCHVSAPRQPSPENSNNNADLQQDEDDTFMSGLLAPLLYCVLMVMWYLRYQYGHLFNTCSSVILLCLTALLLISTYLLYTTQQQQQPSPSTPTANLSSSTTLNTNTVGQITLGTS